MKTLEWTPELSGRFWKDLSGSEYLANIAFSRFAARPLVEMVRDYLKVDGLILDYGAGDNLYLAKELVRGGFRTEYYEPNRTERMEAQTLDHGDQTLGAVSVIAQARYDGIFLSEVIEHLADDQLATVMETLSMALRPDGVLVVTTPDNEDLLNASRYCPVCRHLFHPWGHVRTCSRQWTEDLLLNYGLRCCELHSVDFSSAGKAIEEVKAIKRRIKEFEQIQRQASKTSPEMARLLEQYLELFGDAVISDSPEDPKYRQIGFGGTLVAIAKRSDSYADNLRARLHAPGRSYCAAAVAGHVAR